MIQLQNVNIRLLQFQLKEVNLAIGKNEFFMLMGPTGAGKTVLLEAIAGLIPISRGRIFIDGRDVTMMPSEKREVGIVYQDHALFPHLKVLENITYGLRFHPVGKEEGEKRLSRLTELLNIGHLLRRLPLNLSGGEKQRVALARALMVNPRVLLLDEPFSALDPGFREEVRNALKRLHENSETTFLMVTHDFAEALTLADRGAILHHGAIEQVGGIQDIFHKPVSAAAAEFVGMKNLFKATFRGEVADIGGLEIRLNGLPEGDRRYVAIRPEDIVVRRELSAGKQESAFSATVTAVFSQGFTYEVHVSAGTHTFKALVTKKSLMEVGIREGLPVFVSFDPGSVHCF
jgi:molybdate/tungstate transport system ATP-binding protein